MRFEFEVQSGASIEFKTAGKYCDRNILVTATDDGGYDKGFAEGVASVEAENAVILEQCNSVLPDKGVETADSLEQVPQRIGEIKSYDEGYDVGVEAGKQAEYDRFWDALQNKGNRTNYDKMFMYGLWTDENYNPKYPITCIGDDTVYGEVARSVFNNCQNLTSTKVPIICKDAALSWMFRNCSQLKTIPLLHLENIRSCTLPFVNCIKLENITIDGSIDVNFDISATAVLTNESVQSIIDGLADLTGQTAQTLTFHATVGAKLTDAQKAAITAKNWTLVY